ncbi:Exonuclease [Macleaya cordata]|uniref:Exonuclease n=1 Tax=Macleaya cordata TaxID=56857 RepID=A0A200QKU3_MACCD|nr:Exonuclease [Macleaya cordata]
MAFARVPLSRFGGVFSSNSKLIFRFPNISLSPIRSVVNITSSTATSSSSVTTTKVVVEEAEDSSSSSPPMTSVPTMTTTKRWRKPMCLYYTQGKCTMMDDPIHLQKFDHDCSSGLQVNATDLQNVSAQNLDYLLVLDLEGKVEILEFPVVMIDAKTLGFVDFFHRFVRPTKMSEKRVEEYIEGKYGKIGVDRVWHDTAISFEEVIQQFEIWMTHHRLWDRELGGALRRAAFVTCGNWDLKTKVPQQCKDSSMKLPPYFMEWINLKDIYLNFYKRRATGMMTMMKELDMPLVGSHHLGIDDTKNIARVLQRMLTDGAQMQITARRSSGSLDNVKFLFKNRI